MTEPSLRKKPWLWVLSSIIDILHCVSFRWLWCMVFGWLSWADWQGQQSRLPMWSHDQLRHPFWRLCWKPTIYWPTAWNHPWYHKFCWHWSITRWSWHYTHYINAVQVMTLDTVKTTNLLSAREQIHSGQCIMWSPSKTKHNIRSRNCFLSRQSTLNCSKVRSFLPIFGKSISISTQKLAHLISHSIPYSIIPRFPIP